MVGSFSDIVAQAMGQMSRKKMSPMPPDEEIVDKRNLMPPMSNQDLDDRNDAGVGDGGDSEIGGPTENNVNPAPDNNMSFKQALMHAMSKLPDETFQGGKMGQPMVQQAAVTSPMQKPDYQYNDDNTITDPETFGSYGGEEFIRRQLRERPKPYHDPSHDELVEVPDRKKGKNLSDRPNFGKKMMDDWKNDEGLDDSEFPARYSDGWYDKRDDEIRRQRGPKVKM